MDLTSLLFAGVGFVSAGLGSLLGIGGGLLLVPALSHFTQMPMHEIIPLSLFNIVINSSMVSAQRLQKDLIHLRAATMLEPCCLSGGILSAWIAQHLDGSALARAFAVFCLAMAVYYGRKSLKPEAAEKLPKEARAHNEPFNMVAKAEANAGPAQTAGVLVASTAGSFTAGLLGIGGGVIIVPLLNVGLKLPLKVSAGTSSYIIGTTAVGALLPYLWGGRVQLDAAVWVCLGAALGVYTAGLFFHKLSSRTMTIGFSALLFMISWRMWAR
jgi:uncharacterized membrane protein YfcA